MRWAEASDSGPERLVTPAPEALSDFLALHSAGSAEVHRYARRWGPLRLCAEHGLPAYHRFTLFPHQEPGQRCWPAGIEPVARWVELAQRAQDTLVLADLALDTDATSAQISRRLQRDLAMWDRITEWMYPDIPDWRSPDPDRKRLREVLDDAGTWWLQACSVGPRYSVPSHGRPQLNITGGDLPSYLALTLLLRTTGGVALQDCGQCGIPFAPRKRGDTKYCSDACRNARAAALKRIKRATTGGNPT